MFKNFFKWALTSKTFIFPHKKFTEAILYAVRAKGLVLVPAHSLEKSKGVIQLYTDPLRAAVVSLVNKVKTEVPFLLSATEAYQLYMTAKQSLKVAGEMAEVGVFCGGSAKLICEAKGERPLHIFDTFKGIPNIREIDKSHFQNGELSQCIF